jgi:flagellar hook assembly protein FlgD
MTGGWRVGARGQNYNGKVKNERNLIESTRGGVERFLSSGQFQQEASKKKKKKKIKASEGSRERDEPEVNNPTQDTVISSSNRRPQPGG